MGIVQLVASRLKSDTLKNYNHKMRRQSCKALRISVITEIHFTHKHVRVTMLFSLYLTKIYIIIYIYIDFNKNRYPWGTCAGYRSRFLRTCCTVH